MVFTKCAKNSLLKYFIVVVGAAGFEPAAPWSQTKCATKLRHAPTGSMRLYYTPKEGPFKEKGPIGVVQSAHLLAYETNSLIKIQ